jgi:hypothetical protein
MGGLQIDSCRIQGDLEEEFATSWGLLVGKWQCIFIMMRPEQIVAATNACGIQITK